MSEFSLIDRLITIFKMIFSSTFFICLFVILVLTIIILVINSKLQNKMPKYFLIVGYLIIIVFVFIKYGGYILSINDSVVEKFFSAMYFPNLVVYLSMLLISLLLLAINFINKNFSLLTKICNFSCFGLISFFFVLVLDLVKAEGINVYEITEVYSNDSLMILLQASMCVFIVWIGVIAMNLIVRKLSLKLDLIEMSNLVSVKNKSPEIFSSVTSIDSDEEIRDYTDEEFQIGFLNQKKLSKDEEIREILRHKDINF